MKRLSEEAGVTTPVGELMNLLESGQVRVKLPLVKIKIDRVCFVFIPSFMLVVLIIINLKSQTGNRL